MEHIVAPKETRSSWRERKEKDYVKRNDGYTAEQTRKLEQALDQLEPVPDELDDLVRNLGVLLEKDS